MNTETRNDEPPGNLADSDLAGMTREELANEIEQLRKQVVRLAEEVVRAEMQSWQTQTHRERMEFIVNESSVYKEMLRSQVKELRDQLDTYIARDVERVNAERALSDSMASFDRMQRLIHIGSWEWDIPSDTVVRSRELLGLMGIEGKPEAPAADMVASMQVHPEDATAFDAGIRKVLADGGMTTFNYRMVKPGGEIRSIRTTVEAIGDGHDKIRKLFGIIQVLD